MKPFEAPSRNLQNPDPVRNPQGLGFRVGKGATTASASPPARSPGCPSPGVEPLPLNPELKTVRPKLKTLSPKLTTLSLGEVAEVRTAPSRINMLVPLTLHLV